MSTTERDEVTSSIELRLTKTQERILPKLVEAIMKEANEGGTRYECKSLRVSQFNGSRLVFLNIEVGMIGDENTMASIFCRDSRLISIGPRGALELLNAKLKKNSRGWFWTIHGLTR